ncbi:hypothetical protein ACLK14_09690 [Escherichia coli]
MALLPDKEKLLRNFLRCANWEEKYLYIIELASVCQNYATKTEAHKIAFRAARVRCGLHAPECAGNY